MICPKCKIVTPDELDVCYNCRTPLHPKQQSRAIWFWFFLLLIAVAGGAGYYYFYRMPHPFQQNEVPVMAPKAQTQAPVKKPSAPAAALPPAKSEISRSAAVPIKLTTGLVFIKDVTGKQLAQIPAAVLAGG